jgi:hypothetical protein
MRTSAPEEGQMRTAVIMLVLAAAGLAAAAGVIALTSASLGGCPSALLEGTLEADPSSEGLLVRTDDGQAVTVTWPIGYGVRAGENGEPVLTRLFVEVAGPGDEVSMGGGEGRITDFDACGVIAVTN